MGALRVDIKEPIWYGGKRQVGIAEYKLKGFEMVEVHILYRDRQGNLVYPSPLVAPISQVMKGRRQVVRQGTVLRWISIEDMRVKEVASG